MNILPIILAATLQSAPLGQVPLTTEVVTNGLAALRAKAAADAATTNTVTITIGGK